MNKTTEKSAKKRKSGTRSLDAVDDLDAMTDEEMRLQRNAEILRLMPDNIAEALAKARSKPVWCSDVRWRMELARRKTSKYGF